MDFLDREEANIVEGDQPWILRNWVPLAVVATLVAAVIVAVLAWQTRLQVREQEARLQLLDATTPAKQIVVAEEYLGTQEAAVALMDAASTEFESRNFTSALKAYDLFLEHYPDHPLRAGAMLGRGYTLAAEQKLDAAITALQAAIAVEPETAFRPAAMFEMSQFYAELGQRDRQIEVLQELSENYASSLYGRNAIERLAELKAQAVNEGPSEETGTTPTENTEEAASPEQGDS